MPEAPCPRCGFPEIGGRFRPAEPEAARRGLYICSSCSNVEGIELLQLGEVLPLAQWAVNDR